MAIDEFEETYPFMKEYIDKWRKNYQMEKVTFNFSLAKLVEVLNKTSMRTLANLLFIQAIHEVTPYLSHKIQRIRTKYLGGDELDINIQRQDYCLVKVFEDLPHQGNAVYAQKYISKDLKKKVTDISDQVTDEIRERFKSIQYLDDYTRVNAMKKLNSTKRSLGINDEWFDVSKTDETCKKFRFTLNNFLSNKLQAQSYFNLFYSESFAESYWIINAFNDPSKNKIRK